MLRPFLNVCDFAFSYLWINPWVLFQSRTVGFATVAAAEERVMDDPQLIGPELLPGAASKWLASPPSGISHAGTDHTNWSPEISILSAILSAGVKQCCPHIEEKPFPSLLLCHGGKLIHASISSISKEEHTTYRRAGEMDCLRILEWPSLNWMPGQLVSSAS